MGSVKDNLIAARALIDTPEKWLKREFANGDGCFCAAGALKYGGNFEAGAVWDSSEYEVVCSQLPGGGSRELPRYNDLPSTTHADIMALFDRAIAACDAQVAA